MISDFYPSKTSFYSSKRVHLKRQTLHKKNHLIIEYKQYKIEKRII